MSITTFADLPATFQSKIDQTLISEFECWIWIGYRNAGGYGACSFKRKSWLAHRAIYFLFHDEIPPELDHMCDIRSCVNPFHLRPLSHRENTLRSLTNPTAIHARKTHCIHGHPFSGDNLYIGPSGRRDCVACTRRKHGTLRARPKITETMKFEIQRLYNEEHLSQRAIAESFDLSRSLISYIVRGLR